jgi:hypothetical protein
MAQTIFGLVTNSDDSSHVSWFKNEILARFLLVSDVHLHKYGTNEGSFAEELTFPDDLDLIKCGFCFSDGYYENLVKEIDE